MLFDTQSAATTAPGSTTAAAVSTTIEDFPPAPCAPDSFSRQRLQMHHNVICLYSMVTCRKAELAGGPRCTVARHSFALISAAPPCFHADSLLTLRSPATGAAIARRIADAEPGDQILVGIGRLLCGAPVCPAAAW